MELIISIPLGFTYTIHSVLHVEYESIMQKRNRQIPSLVATRRQHHIMWWKLVHIAVFSYSEDVIWAFPFILTDKKVAGRRQSRRQRRQWVNGSNGSSIFVGSRGSCVKTYWPWPINIFKTVSAVVHIHWQKYYQCNPYIYYAVMK